MYLVKSFSAEAAILKNVQILLVDNDRDTRELYNVLLKDCGATLMLAGTVKEALAMLTWRFPDILVCEIRFFGESVALLLRQLMLIATAYGRHIPILIISTCPINSFKKILGIEVEGYLLKPIEPDDLVLKIWDLVRANKTPSSTYSLEPRMELESEPNFLLELLASA